MPAALFPVRSRLVGALAIIASALMFALNGVVSKIILTVGGIGPMRLLSLRLVCAAAIQVVLLALVSRREFRQPARELGKLAILGVIGIAFMQYSYFSHLARLPVSIGLLIQYLAPLCVVLVARFLFGERVRPRMWAAVVFCVGGLALVAQVRPGSHLDAVGVAWALAATASLTIYYLVAERAVAQASPLATQTWMLIFAAATWSLIMPVWTFDVALLARPVALPGPWAGQSVALGWLFAFMVLVGTTLAYLLAMWGVKRIGAPRAGLLGMAEPVAITFLGWLILSEALTWAQWLGAGVTIVGVMLAATARRGGPARRHAAR